MLNESDIVNRLKKEFPDYIGDDAAVLPLCISKNHVVTKDLLIEDVHFRAEYVDAASLAHKVVHVNLSDLAAMGACPEFILLGVAIPLLYEKYAQAFLEQFALVCQKSKVILIGGDTTKSSDKLVISVTAIGFALHQNLKYRNTAQVGDVICIAGSLGTAHLGLIACERKLKGFDYYKNSFLKPQAKIEEGQWLGFKQSVHSMMDISDGLVVDLKRLCEASNVQANIKLEQIKLSGIFIDYCKRVGLNAIEVALIGGEDYGLLFTVARASVEALKRSFKKQFGYPIQCIGHFCAGKGIQFTENNLPKNLILHTFSHFGEAL